MAFFLTLKRLNRQSPANLAAILTVLKQDLELDLPSIEDLRKLGTHTIELPHKKLGSIAHALAESGVSIAIQNREAEPTPFERFYSKYEMGLVQTLAGLNTADIEDLAKDLLYTRTAKHTAFIFGNGGSAATASHFASDFSKDRFKNRELLFRVICLNDCIPVITALSNDEGYENVFSGQLNSLLKPDDIAIAISSSGNSPNIVKALKLANERGAKTLAIVGFNGGEAQRIAKRNIYIPTKPGQYGFMEDISVIITHMLSIYLKEHDETQLKQKEI